jgi:hypothetical protein
MESLPKILSKQDRLVSSAYNCPLTVKRNRRVKVQLFRGTDENDFAVPYHIDLSRYVNLANRQITCGWIVRGGKKY